MKSTRQSLIVFISFVLIHLPINAQEVFTDDEFECANTLEMETRLPDAASQNVPNTLVKRNNHGSFSANIVTAKLNGLANSAKTFTQALTGDVTGGQSSTVVANVGGKSASDIVTTVTTVSAATSLNIPDTIMRRDSLGNVATKELFVSELEGVFEPALVDNSPFFGGGISDPNCIALSNNGKFLVVTNKNASTLSMFLVSLGTGALTPIISSPFSGANLDTPLYPAFSMDGNFLAVTCSGEAPGMAPGVDIFSVNSSTGALTEVAFYSIPGSPQELMYSPDDRWLAVANVSGSVSMFSVDHLTGTLTEVTGSPFSTPSPYALDFSHDSAYLAVVSPTDETVSVFEVNQMTGALTEIIDSPFTTTQLPRSVKKSLLRTPPLPGFVRYSPQGDFLAVSNLTQNTIAFFSVNQGSGVLTSLDNSVFIDSPFNVEFSKNNLLLAVSERGDSPHGSVRIFNVDQESGILTDISNSGIDVGDVPTCVRFFPNDEFLAVLLPVNNKIGVLNVSTAITVEGSLVVEGNIEFNESTLFGGSIRIAGQPFISAPGDLNTFIGSQAGNFSLSGAHNVAVGALAMQHIHAGSNNVAIGLEAGDDLQTGDNNIYITAAAGSSSESDTIRIGTDATSCYISGIDGATSASGVPVLVNASGQLGTVTSSEKYKKNINNVSSCVVDGLAKIRTVEFQYNEELDPLGIKQFGFLAEEVAQICPDLVVFKNGKPETIRYHLFIPLLVSAYQELFASQQAQQKKIDELESNFKKLENLNANVDQKA